MDLTTRIFKDLAAVAQWAFQSTKCDPGKYSLQDIARDKDCNFDVRHDFLQWQNLPSCAERVDESDDIVRLSYNNGANIYEFRVSCIFAILREYKRIATEDITAKERNELCTMVKQGEQQGEIIAIVEMPKTLTKQVAKAAGKDPIRPMFNGVYVDGGGYIVATNSYVLNICKTVVSCDKDFTGELLPTDFTKRSDGQTVEIYRDGSHVYARCGDDVVTCANVRYPNWRSVLPKVSNRGCMQVSAKAIAKVLKNMDAEITMSCKDGHISMSCDGIRKELDGEGCADFSGTYYAANLTSIMQPCTAAYVTRSGRATAFVGQGVASLVMPTDQYSNYDFVGGENDLKNVLDLMDTAEPEPKKTKSRKKAQKAEPSTPEEEKPNESNYTEYVQAEASAAIRNESESANDMPKHHRTIATTTANRMFLPVSAQRYPNGIFVHVAKFVATRRKYGGVTARRMRTEYWQFTRGSTIGLCTTGEKGGNKRIINHYPGELYCRGG